MGTTMLAGRLDVATGRFAVKKVPVPAPEPSEMGSQPRGGYGPG
jgi:hypothetical protein